MGKQNSKLNSAWLYCFKRGSTAVFLNRWDEVIKEFDYYKECEQYATENIHLIDKKL